MNVTNLCLNVDIKVNLNYPDWRLPMLLLEIIARILILNDLIGKITFISVITSIIWREGIYVEKEILGTLDINSNLGFLTIFGLIKATWWLPKDFFLFRK